ncbi:hypothetical protein EW146_g9320 [Bondarzewia mesenterica]|uniref:C2H2-type domain-containing protein n=1 Tax=Bondarzewia mesenterica TaxID=1095465 RepID=A0A4S4LCM5_9AGAM|nr:hypothetical protein EW146_g9320 [Bondarzewia mesenterica]
MNAYNVDFNFPNHPSPVLSNMDWSVDSHMITAAELTDQEWAYIQSLTREWRRSNNEPTPTPPVSNHDMPLQLNQGWQQAQLFPPVEPPLGHDLGMRQTDLWSNVNKTTATAEAIPSPPVVPFNYGISPPVDNAFSASMGYSNAQAPSPSTTPSTFVFATPIVHNLVAPDLGYPSITFFSHRGAATINKTSDREEETAVTETLPSNNSTTGNHASGDSVLTGNGILAVSSQTAGPSGSQNTEDEVEESGASAKAYEELQDRAVAALKKDNADRKWPCTMPGCDKRFRRQQEAQRHITDTKEHRHPQCEGKHMCEDCGKKFGRRDSMARHQKSGACERLRKKAAALIGV